MADSDLMKRSTYPFRPIGVQLLDENRDFVFVFVKAEDEFFSATELLVHEVLRLKESLLEFLKHSLLKVIVGNESVHLGCGHGSEI